VFLQESFARSLTPIEVIFETGKNQNLQRSAGSGQALWKVVREKVEVLSIV
jgi:hypothetical protein